MEKNRDGDSKVTRLDVVAPKIGVRQANAIKKRKHLSGVVMELVGEKGFDAISVNEVAERASMSVGGLYRHISTKNDLLELICDEINLDLLDDLKAAAAAVKGIANKLRAAYALYWSKHWEASEAILIAYREYKSLSPESKQRYVDQEQQIAQFFADLIKAGALVDEFCEVDADLLAHEMIFLAHMRALKGWAMKSHAQEKIFQHQMTMVLSILKIKE